MLSSLANLDMRKATVCQEVLDFFTGEGKGLTQAELGKKMQISQDYNGEIERGLVNVSMETLGKIVKALGITLYELFDFRDIDIGEQYLEKEAIVEEHKKMLLERNLSEDKMIHNITKEIVRTIDQNN